MKVFDIFVPEDVPYKTLVYLDLKERITVVIFDSLRNHETLVRWNVALYTRLHEIQLKTVRGEPTHEALNAGITKGGIIHPVRMRFTYYDPNAPAYVNPNNGVLYLLAPPDVLDSVTTFYERPVAGGWGPG